MQRTEILNLLDIVSSFVPNYDPKDQKKINAWQRVLGNMAYKDAERYFYKHFEKNKYVPMPVEILDRARAEFNPDSIVPLEPPDDMRGAQPNVE